MKTSSEEIGSRPARVSGARRRILIADDELVVVRCIESLLHSAGYKNLAFATDGSKALSQIIEEPPALVILDAMMPKVDGRFILQSLKEKESTAKIPIVVVTSLSGRSLDYYLEKADAVIQKPFDRQELLAHVSRLLGVGAPEQP